MTQVRDSYHLEHFISHWPPHGNNCVLIAFFHEASDARVRDPADFSYMATEIRESTDALMFLGVVKWTDPETWRVDDHRISDINLQVRTGSLEGVLGGCERSEPSWRDLFDVTVTAVTIARRHNSENVPCSIGFT